MLISLEWLADYIDVSDLKVAELEETLTMLGLEVEGVENIPAIDDLVVVGKILQTAPHPDAQRLTLCTVDSGAGGIREIVCGANNVKPDMLIALAQPGTRIQGQELKSVTIRGKVSQGMICSEKELGLGDEHDGILPLDPNLTIGAKVSTVFPIADTVLDVSITPNRGDCLSYLGIARELQAKLDRPLQPPLIEQLATKQTTEKVEIHLEPDSGCQRFCSLHVQTETSIPTSPFHIRRRLQVTGIRPINAVVDITNYIMLECGQPLHAYDAREISSRVIRVKRAKEADKFISLDGKPRDINAGDILICDAQRIIGLAGIIGGENSEIKNDTQEMVIELAHFDDISVRRTAKRLGIHTESSHRFERGTDVGYLHQVALRTRYLLSKNLPPQTAISAQPSDLYPDPRPEKKKIAVRLPRARKVLGLPALTQGICQHNLELLSFKLLDQTEERLLFAIPTWRNDIEREIDLIEEIGRISGLDHVPYELPVVRQSMGIADSFADFQTAVKVRLATLGLQETVSFAMVSPQDYETKLAISPTHPLYPRLELSNPINDQLQAMQTTLLPNLLRCVSKNRNYRIRGTRLFEVGRSYFASKEKIADTLAEFPHFAYLQEQGVHIKATDRPYEQNLVAGIIDTPFKFSGWQGKELQPDIYLGKKLVFDFLSGFGISPREITVRTCGSRDYPFLNPFASMCIYVRDFYLGYAGELHPKVLTSFKIEEKVLFFELWLDKIFRLKKVAHANNHMTKYPPVHRDLAFVLPATKPYQEIMQAFKNFPQRTHLTDFRLFDIFTDSSIGEERKSMAFSVYFSSPERTLTDTEVDTEVANLITWMEKELTAKLR